MVVIVTFWSLDVVFAVGFISVTSGLLALLVDGLIREFSLCPKDRLILDEKIINKQGTITIDFNSIADNFTILNLLIMNIIHLCCRLLKNKFFTSS